MRFRDRADAGRRLAERLVEQLVEQPLRDPYVLALPRGGVPVAAPVAAALHAPLVPFVARKIGAPGRPEYGIGAIAEGDPDVIATPAAGELGLSPERMRALADAERAELRRRVQAYRAGAALPALRGRDVVLVDDGLATGVTAEAALRALRRLEPRRLVLAVPVAAPDTARRLEPLADALVCLTTPRRFEAVGHWYEHFDQTGDDEVLAILRAAAGTGPP